MLGKWVKPEHKANIKCAEFKNKLSDISDYLINGFT